IGSMQAGRRRPFVPPSRLALVRVPILLSARRFDDARAALRLALRGRPSRDERLWLLVDYATAAGEERPSEGNERLEHAPEVAGHHPNWRPQILYMLAQRHAEVDDL